MVLYALTPLIALAMTTQEPAFIVSSSTEEVALVPHEGILLQSAQAGIRMTAQTATTSVKDMVVSAFPDAPVMVDVARAESSFNPTIKNPNSTATGVFQILIGTWKGYGCAGSRIDAADNISCARKIYDTEGTRPWVSSSDNW